MIISNFCINIIKNTCFLIFFWTSRTNRTNRTNCTSSPYLLLHVFQPGALLAQSRMNGCDVDAVLLRDVEECGGRDSPSVRFCPFVSSGAPPVPP